MPLKIYFASAEINYRCIKDTPTENWLVSHFTSENVHDRLSILPDDAAYLRVGDYKQEVTTPPGARQNALVVSDAQSGYNN